MARCVDKVELVHFTVLAPVVQPHGLGLDGNAPLPLQLHIVQHLGLHFPLGKGARILNEAVGNGGLAVVNMGDDGKIADMLVLHKISFQKLPKKPLCHKRAASCIVNAIYHFASALTLRARRDFLRAAAFL